MAIHVDRAVERVEILVEEGALLTDRRVADDETDLFDPNRRPDRREAIPPREIDGDGRRGHGELRFDLARRAGDGIGLDVDEIERETPRREGVGEGATDALGGSGHQRGRAVAIARCVALGDQPERARPVDAIALQLPASRSARAINSIADRSSTTPPSTGRMRAVTKLDAGDARKRAACAMSAGVPWRSSGVHAISFSPIPGHRRQQILLHVLRRDGADANPVHTDPRRVLHRHHPRQLLEGRLRAAVGNRADVRRTSEARRDVDDRAAAPSSCGAPPRGSEGRLEVEREGGVEMFVRRVFRRDMTAAARVVHDDVDPAERRERRVDDPIRRIGSDEITVDRDRPPTDRLGRRAGAQQVRPGPRDADDRRPRPPRRIARSRRRSRGPRRSRSRPSRRGGMRRGSTSLGFPSEDAVALATWRWRIAISWRRSSGVTRFVPAGSAASTSFAFTTFIEIVGQSGGSGVLL